jgi:hypothetical protein
VNAPLLLLGAVAVAVGLTAGGQAKPEHWGRAYVTAYSTSEQLTGCTRPGVCREACGGYLDDRRLTVAANPRLGLSCHAAVEFLYRSRVVRARVEDRTASSYAFEFSRALAAATGRAGAAWDAPRWILWRPA